MSYQKTLKIPNKANLKIDLMSVTKVLTTDYNRMDTWCRGKNKANSNPIFWLLEMMLFIIYHNIYGENKEDRIKHPGQL